MLELAELRMAGEVAQLYVVGHWPGGRGDRHRHCRIHRLLVLRMLSSSMEENGPLDGVVLGLSGWVLSVGLWVIVCSLAKVQDKATAAESVQRHASSIEESLFDVLPLRAYPNCTVKENVSRLCTAQLHVELS
jgi:hypothetical protein